MWDREARSQSHKQLDNELNSRKYQLTEQPWCIHFLKIKWQAMYIYIYIGLQQFNAFSTDISLFFQINTNLLTLLLHAFLNIYSYCENVFKIFLIINWYLYWKDACISARKIISSLVSSWRLGFLFLIARLTLRIVHVIIN